MAAPSNPSNSDASQESASNKYKELAENPSLRHIKDLVEAAPDCTSPGNHQYALASILVSWTSAEPEAIAKRKEQILSKKELKLAGVTSQFLDASKWYTEVITTPLFGPARPSRTAVTMDSALKGEKVETYHQISQELIKTLCIIHLDIYYRSSDDEPAEPNNKIILPAFRVRDIVVYRYLKSDLEKAGMSECRVITDNVLDPWRKEHIAERIYAFCGNCFDFATTHSRCGSCKVGVHI